MKITGAVCFVLSVLMLFGALPGCRPATVPEPNTAIDREHPVSVTVGLISWGEKIPYDDADFIRKELINRIKVDVKLETVDNYEDYRNRLNVQIVSGSAPDFFQIPDRNALIEYTSMDTLAEITPLEAKLGQYLSFVGTEHNKTYIGDKSYAVVKKGAVNFLGLWIRKDWLEKLGLGFPDTPEKLLETAIAFTYSDPDGNGIDDTYGVTGIRYGAFATVFGGYDVPYEPAQIYVKNNRAVAAFMDPAYKEALEVCKRFIDAGAVDPTLMLNMGIGQRDPKLYSGKFGITMADWTTFKKDENLDKVKSSGSGVEWIQLPPLKGPYASYVTYADIGGSGTLFGLSKNVENNPEKPDAFIDLLNYISSDGNTLVMYGLKGTHWKESDNEIKMTAQGEAEASYTWLYQFTGRPEMEYLMTKFSKQAGDIKTAAEYPVFTTLSGFVDRPGSYIPSDAQKYMDEELIKFLYGLRDMSEYDQFIETVNGIYHFTEYLDTAQIRLKELGYIN